MSRRIPARWLRVETLLLLVLAAVIFGVWMLCARGYGKGWMDDLPYSHICTPDMTKGTFFLCMGKPVETLGDIFSSIYYHYLVVNGRFANSLMFIYVMLPPWLGPVLQGGLYALMVCGIMRLGVGRGWRSQPLALILTVCLIWTVFMWDDMYASADFMINYMWTSAGVVWSLIAIFTPELCRRKRWLWVIIPTAMMHEAAGATAVGGIIAYMIVERERLWADKRQLLLPCAFLLFSLVPIITPALGEHIDDRYLIRVDGKMLLYRVILKNWFVVLISLAYAIWSVRKKNWKKLAVYEAMILLNVVIFIISFRTDRAFWFAYLAATVMLLDMCHGIRVNRQIKFWLSIPVAALLLWWGIQLCKWQWRCSLERDAVVAELRQGHPEGDYVLSPVTNYYEMPWWLFNMVGTVGEMGTSQRNYIYLDNRKCHPKYEYRFIPLPPAATLEESLNSLPVLPSGLRGNKSVVVSKKEIPQAYLMYKCSKESSGDLSSVNPIYSLRTYSDDDATCFPSYSDPVILKMKDGEILYLYRPAAIPRSLWNYELADAWPAIETGCCKTSDL